MGISNIGNQGLAVLNRCAVLTTSGTWSHPDGKPTLTSPKLVRIVVIGGGGGGGSGSAIVSSSSSTIGPNGGNAGYVRDITGPIFDDLVVTIGAGGVGGSPVTATPTTTITTGLGGSAGGDTSVAYTGFPAVPIMIAYGGSGAFLPQQNQGTMAGAVGSNAGGFGTTPPQINGVLESTQASSAFIYPSAYGFASSGGGAYGRAVSGNAPSGTSSPVYAGPWGSGGIGAEPIVMSGSLAVNGTAGGDAPGFGGGGGGGSVTISATNTSGTVVTSGRGGNGGAGAVIIYY